MFKKLIATAAVVGALSAAGCAAGATEPEYELKRVGGPRNDIYVRVPTEKPQAAEQPYALTGHKERKSAERRVQQRWAGPRYVGPAYVYERQDD